MLSRAVTCHTRDIVQHVIVSRGYLVSISMPVDGDLIMYVSITICRQVSNIQYLEPPTSRHDAQRPSLP